MLNKISQAAYKRNKTIRVFCKKILRNRYESVNDRRIDLGVFRWFFRKAYGDFDPRKRAFEVVSIQTQTGCNYSCPFCPSNKPGLNLYGGSGLKAKMEPALFNGIIEQLAALKFRGRISLDLINEPLMDPRLPDFIRVARKKCPAAFMFLQTNGSLLNEELFLELIDAGLDELYVNDYTFGHNIFKKLSGLQIDKSKREHLTLEKRSFEERLSNRAGNAGIFPLPEKPLALPCVKPFRQISVAYDGRALLCCQDWQFTQVLGDAGKETLLDIWASQGYQAIRAKLKSCDRANNSLCAQCDFSGLW